MNLVPAKFIIGSALVIGAITPFVLQRKSEAQWHTCRETERDQAAELAALQASRAKDATAAQAREQAVLRQEAEKSRLRAEIAHWHQEQLAVDTVKKFRELAGPAIAAAYQQTPANRKPRTQGSIALGELEDAGGSTPEALLKTMRRALAHADIDALVKLTSFDAASRPKLDRWFAELSPDDQARFVTPERLFAAMVFNAAFPFPAESGLEVGELKQPTPNEASLHYRIRVPDGRVLLSEDFPARHGADGWTYPASDQTVSALMTTFNYLPSAQRKLLGRPPSH
jgi:hypothetical protein